MLKQVQHDDVVGCLDEAAEAKRAASLLSFPRKRESIGHPRDPDGIPAFAGMTMKEESPPSPDPHQSSSASIALAILISRCDRPPASCVVSKMSTRFHTFDHSG